MSDGEGASRGQMSGSQSAHVYSGVIMTQVTAERRHGSTITLQDSRSSQGQTVAMQQKAVSEMPEVRTAGIIGV